MYRIKIFSIGKTKEPWLLEALAEYEKRLRSIMPIEWIFAKNNEQLRLFLEKEPPFIVLTPKGQEFPSEAFSDYLSVQLENCGSRLSFVIGGAEGIPSDIEEKAIGNLSLSKLTFTHQIARLILIEQLYRFTEIQKGSGYHK